ncbi:MAG: HAD hydrolase-like protein, partial [Mailhella sp.]|nr:HAD hydrolase-like protein [Mailhella sp.]
KLSYMNEIMPHITHFPDLHGVLDLCKAAGIPMGIDTNRMNGMDIILDNCRLHGYFDPIVLVDSVPHPKPAPDGAFFIAEKWGLEPASLLFIGDSASDRGAAQSAGIPFLSFQNQSLAKQSIAEYSVLQEALQSLGL